MRNRTVKLLVLGLLNAAAYHYAYVDFLYVMFDYAGFHYEETSNAYLVFTYLVAALPLLASRESNEPSAVGSALIYGLSYVPIQLTFTFLWVEKTVELVSIQSLLALSMTVLFRTAAPAREGSLPYELGYGEVFFERNRMTTAIHVLSILGLALMLIEFHSIMKIVSFEDVYDLRGDAAEIQASTLTSYLMMWLTYCFGPFYIARALIRGRKQDWAAGMAILVLIYAATGSKLALLTPLFMFAMKYIENGRDEFLVRFLTVVGVSVSVLVLVIPQEGILRWVNAIFLMRVFGSNGWSAAVYYEFFSSHGFTFYTHIGPVNALFGGYPYGDHSLGQEIARFYLNSETANMNAGFWASDAFAAFGLLGIFVVTAFLCWFMKELDRMARYFPLRLINLWLLGFWMALMNVPLSTALLSCGGLMALFLLRSMRPRQQVELVCA
jgi:hypothetical protein